VLTQLWCSDGAVKVTEIKRESTKSVGIEVYQVGGHRSLECTLSMEANCKKGRGSATYQKAKNNGNEKQYDREQQAISRKRGGAMRTASLPVAE
jgi:Flp pilus assembly secretin CpaC